MPLQGSLAKWKTTGLMRDPITKTNVQKKILTSASGVHMLVWINMPTDVYFYKFIFILLLVNSL